MIGKQLLFGFASLLVLTLGALTIAGSLWNSGAAAPPRSKATTAEAVIVAMKRAGRPFLQTNNTPGVPVIKICSTWSAYGNQAPYAQVNDQAGLAAVNQINANGGVTIAGTRYEFEWFTFNVDGSDCNITSLMYQLLITNYSCDFLMSMDTDGSCSTPSDLAEQYGVVFMNAQDYGLTFNRPTPGPQARSWSFTILADSFSLTTSCTNAYAAAGARTAVIVGDSDFAYAFDPLQAYADALANITVLDSMTVDIANYTANPDMLNATLSTADAFQRWKALKPDALHHGL